MLTVVKAGSGEIVIIGEASGTMIGRSRLFPSIP
jgi:hypothetical protein